MRLTINNIDYGTIEPGASAPLWSDRANRKHVATSSLDPLKVAEFWSLGAAEFWLTIVGAHVLNLQNH